MRDDVGRPSASARRRRSRTGAPGRAAPPSARRRCRRVRRCTSIIVREQRVAGVDQVVAEQHRERLVADVAGARTARRGRGRAGRPGARSARRRARSTPGPARAASCRPSPRSAASSSQARSKWSSSERLLRPVTMQDVVQPGARPPPRRRTGSPACRRPAASPWASPWSPGRKRVPRPAAGITALVTAGPSPSPDAVKEVRSVMSQGYPAWLTVAAPGDIPAMRHASRPARLARVQRGVRGTQHLRGRAAVHAGTTRRRPTR